MIYIFFFFFCVDKSKFGHSMLALFAENISCDVSSPSFFLIACVLQTMTIRCAVVAPRELYITEFKSVKTGFHNAGSIKSWPLRREIGEASVFSSHFSRESKPKPCIFVSVQLTTRTT